MSYLTVNLLRKSPRKTSDKPEDKTFLVPLGKNLKGKHFQSVPPTSHLSGKTQGEKTSRQASPGSRSTAPALSVERMLYVSAVIKTFVNIPVTRVLVRFSLFFSTIPLPFILWIEWATGAVKQLPWC